MIGKSGRAPHDPLLAIVRIVLFGGMALTLFAAAALAVGTPLMFVWRDSIVARLSGHGAPPEVIWAIIAVSLMMIAMAVLGFFFFRHLYRIIGTVGDGDPFVPVNADRLRAMAWLSLAVHVLAVPSSMLGGWIASVTERVRIEMDLPLSGLLLALVLFILARVFREGTRMRADLEGTV